MFLNVAVINFKTDFSKFRKVNNRAENYVTLAVSLFQLLLHTNLFRTQKHIFFVSPQQQNLVARKHLKETHHLEEEQ